MPRAPSLDRLFKDLDADELREVLRALCKLSVANRQFAELFLRGSDEDAVQPILDEADRKLRGCFMTTKGRPHRRPALAAARALVMEYERLLAEYPAAAAEVALRYVEAGADSFAGYENVWYNPAAALPEALARMYDRFAGHVRARPALAARLADRMRRLEGEYGLGRHVRHANAALARDLATRPRPPDPDF